MFLLLTDYISESYTETSWSPTKYHYAFVKANLNQVKTYPKT